MDEKFTIAVNDQGVIIQDRDKNELLLTPVEALMLLDILKNEEAKLKKLAKEASPLPLSIKF